MSSTMPKAGRRNQLAMKLIPKPMATLMRASIREPMRDWLTAQTPEGN